MHSALRKIRALTLTIKIRMFGNPRPRLRVRNSVKLSIYRDHRYLWLSFTVTRAKNSIRSRLFNLYRRLESLKSAPISTKVTCRRYYPLFIHYVKKICRWYHTKYGWRIFLFCTYVVYIILIYSTSGLTFCIMQRDGDWRYTNKTGKMWNSKVLRFGMFLRVLGL